MSRSMLAPGAGERLHARIRLVWAAGVVLVALLVLAGSWLVDRFLVGLPPWVGPAASLSVLVVGLALAVWRYRIWRFELQEDALVLRRGVLTRVETAVPYVRLQHIDTRRGPIDRVVGLSSVVVYTAGTRGSDVTVPGLGPDRASRLRDRLRERAVEAGAQDAV